MRLLQFVSLVSHVFDRYLNPSLIISCLKSILLIIKFSILYHYCISTLRPNQTSIFCTPLVIILVTYLMSINSWYLMWRKIWCAFSTRFIPSWYRVESLQCVNVRWSCLHTEYLALRCHWWRKGLSSPITGDDMSTADGDGDPRNNWKEARRWGVAEIQKMSPSTTGRCSRHEADQCTFGYDVQVSQMAISGQKPSWAHLLVAHAPPCTAK